MFRPVILLVLRLRVYVHVDDLFVFDNLKNADVFVRDAAEPKMGSVRNVFRGPIWTNKSPHLRPFRLCYVSYHRSDCCARNVSVRNVWRASFRFFCTDLGTPRR